MIHEVNIHAEFGNCPCDGSHAYAFRVTNIDPYLSICESLEINFSGVRTTNSSFVNALLVGLFEQHGPILLQKLSFRGCLPTIQVLIQAAVDLGMIKHEERCAKSC